MSESRASRRSAGARNVDRWLPRLRVFGRLLLIMLASVGVPHAIALLIAPEAHRASLLGALFMLLPPVALRCVLRRAQHHAAAGAAHGRGGIARAGR